MQCWAVDGTGDLKIRSRQLVRATGAEAVGRTAQKALQDIRGEWLEDPDRGIPWLYEGDRETLEALVRLAGAQSVGVDSIGSFTSRLTDGTLTIRMELVTTEGLLVPVQVLGV